MHSKELRAKLIGTQLEGLLDHVAHVRPLTLRDREAAAKATSALIMAARLEAGEPVDISVVREGVSSIDDALRMLEQETEGAEEASSSAAATIRWPNP